MGKHQHDRHDTLTATASWFYEAILTATTLLRGYSVGEKYRLGSCRALRKEGYN